MDYYQHDGATTFRFQLAGELAGPWVTDLDHAWITANSIMRDKQLILDLSDLTGADSKGMQLLQRMTRAGARLISAEPPAAPELLSSLGAPVCFTPRRIPAWSVRSWIQRMLGRS